MTTPDRSRWTAADVPDQTGRTALVTGASSGLGRRTALVLAGRGARVLLGCRDAGRGQAVLTEVAASATGAAPELVMMDLADQASVARAADDVLARTPALDLLVNNAGIMAVPYARTVDGFESQLATNHLGHFALTGRLVPVLRAASAPRVVTVASEAHRIGRIALDDLQGERRYRRWRAYGQSKLANLLFTLELDRRASAAGSRLVAVAAHPGYAATNLQSAGMGRNPLGALLARVGNAVVAQSDAMGALPQLRAATAPDVAGGEYYGPDGRSGARGWPRLVAAAPPAYDAEVAARLWLESERLTGVRYALA